jgi:hypothetical protein
LQTRCVAICGGGGGGVLMLCFSCDIQRQACRLISRM